MNTNFDIIVIGAGHAGAEAAVAASKMGAATLLVTQNLDTIGQMSCNPAIGGLGKSQLVREIDAMGGVMAQATDAAGIHFRVLNASKGTAVRATRAQCDRTLYKRSVRRYLEMCPNLYLFQQSVEDLVIESGQATGIVTQMGLVISAKAIVITVGTFLGGRIHIGDRSYGGGRAGESPATRLAERLRTWGFKTGRLKTGTPPRIDGRTIDYSKLLEQPGDDPRPTMSFLGDRREHPSQVCCHIAETNEKTHEIIRAALDRSPMFTGAITGPGPRYCPSIEDKVVRFSQKNSHRIFVEPEGLDTREVYPNGISTSLPFDVQLAAIRSIAGFEKAIVTRPGYAIEYDYFDPRGLHLWLETVRIKNLFFAGQINGTTGYEEAAAQGLIAGINAALRVKQQAPWWPKREEAYIGVLIDDLTTRGTSEPYRMFTSRAEYRLQLREDNADFRLTPVAHQLGLVGGPRWSRFSSRRSAHTEESKRLRSTRITPGDLPSDWVSRHLDGRFPKTALTAWELLARPGVSYEALSEVCPSDQQVTSDVRSLVKTESHYEGYLRHQNAEVARLHRQDRTVLPTDLRYDEISGLSNEAKELLSRYRPDTIGQAARIPGFKLADVSLLVVHIAAQSRAAEERIREAS